MTIPYLEGWGDTLAKHGPQIGQNLTEIFNPNKKFEDMLKAAIAKDPTVLQQVANNPGLAQALQKVGLGNLTQQTQGLQVDPNIEAQRRILQSKANVAQGTEQSDISLANNQARLSGTQADLAQGTLQSNIKKSKNEAELSDLQLTDIRNKLADTQAALAKFPDLQNIDLAGTANAIASGQHVDPLIAARIGNNPAAQSALDTMVKGIGEARERVGRMNIAQLVHHSASNQDRQFNLSLLKGLSDSIAKQIGDAVALTRSIKQSDVKSLMTNVPEPEDKTGPAYLAWKQNQADREAYLNARQIASPGSEYYKRLQLVNSKMAALAGLPESVFVEPATETIDNPSTTPQPDALVNQFKQMYISGEGTAAQLKKAKDEGVITDAQLKEILASKVEKKQVSQAPSRTGSNDISGNNLFEMLKSAWQTR